MNLIESAKSGKCYTVVAAQCEQFWSWVCLMRQSRITRAEFEERFAHLLESNGIVKRGDRYVTTVENGIWGRVWIQPTTRIEATERELAS